MYLEQRKLPYSLAFRVRRYFKHYYKTKTPLDESKILDKLSPQLRQEVSSFVLGQLINKHALFKDLPTGTISRLLQVLHLFQVSEGTVMHGTFRMTTGPSPVPGPGRHSDGTFW